MFNYDYYDGQDEIILFGTVLILTACKSHYDTLIS